jgi:hypothetical protein
MYAQSIICPGERWKSDVALSNVMLEGRNKLSLQYKWQNVKSDTLTEFPLLIAS